MQIRLLIYFGSLILFLEGINAQSRPSVKGELYTLVPLPEHSKALFITFAYLEKYHYRKIKLNDSLSAIVFSNYFDGLDPSKVFFLKSDFDYFERYKFQLDDELSSEKLDFGFQLFNLYQSRALRRYEGISEVLEKGFDFFRDFASRKAQIASFEAHIEIAIETRLPMFLHEREAHATFLDILKACLLYTSDAADE